MGPEASVATVSGPLAFGESGHVLRGHCSSTRRERIVAYEE